MKKEWFASWFDSPYYHVLYQSRCEDEASRFIKNLMSYLNLPEGKKVLDLACGKGRHSRTLSELGMDVLGVDLSENSIAEASKFGTSKLRFKVHDMREELDEQFSLVLNLFTSFGYFEDNSENEKVIAAIHSMLEPRGKLVIDFMNARKVVQQLVCQEYKEIDGIRFEISRKYDGQHIIKDIQFTDKGGDYHYTERVQALDYSYFHEQLSRHGFRILTTFGDFELNDFSETESERLIIIAERE